MATPSIDKFGYAELKRMVVIYLTISLCLLRALAQKVVRRRKGSWATVASEGAIDAFEALGPTFVKLGQLIALVAGHLPGAARRTPRCAASTRCRRSTAPPPGR